MIDRALNEECLTKSAGPFENVEVVGESNIATGHIHHTLVLAQADSLRHVNFHGIPAGFQPGHGCLDGASKCGVGENLRVIRAFDRQPGGQTAIIKLATDNDGRVAAGTRGGRLGGEGRCQGYGAQEQMRRMHDNCITQ